MNIYKLLKLAGANSIPAPFKVFGLLGLHVAGRRTLGVFMDPVMACNLRCKMCYFSDPVKRASLHGVISGQHLDNVERALFHRVIKLQIGCGAEPTLYRHLGALVKRGRDAGIPYISLTTNGMLLTSTDGAQNPVAQLIEVGLNELTLSMHGTTKAVYEELMPGACFDRLLVLIEELREVKKLYPSFRLRVNYTVNSLNIDDLREDRFWGLWGDGFAPDILQIRPVQNMGETEWNDFDLTSVKKNYDATLGALSRECMKRHITCIMPSLKELDAVATPQDGVSATIEDLTYCYVSPQSCYHADFDPAADTYETYHKRKHTVRRLLKLLFNTSSEARERNSSKKLNYRVK